MTAAQTWSTEALPEKVRFGAWAEKMRALHMDWDLSTSLEDSYAARIRHRKTRQVQVADVHCAAFAGQYSPSPGTPVVVGIQLQLSGRLTCTYGDDQFIIEPGDLFVWDSIRGGTFDSTGQQRQVSLLIPATFVPQAIASTLGESRPLAAHPGAGLLSIAADQLRGLAREMDRLSDEAINRTVSSLLDLLDTAVVPLQGTASGERAALLSRIQEYILEHLGDRRMSVSSVAAAHGVSVRTLHLVFSESGTSAARWTRQQRLERCRRELADATGSTTVTDVAFRWGFSDTAHFSRAFKQEFGVPPTAVMPKRGQR
ncbi:helix-turn-helix domain-containing protein [Arthrobacter caoxuetaonis]|uniref:Helix-turn-helix domain-containing protein n=1 Tax=Arthrobacter caoxuetaonis TaxID=2886935 RepID=A0A9X1MF27_9MICC|nr:helix-turn-helix domain-containing protein [Arthrobacter caoxuetaonis]MCC3298441.1 helix-turn-helix domain-containing protein [Arthrobacter caoxuetaonis]USQ57545.1 helix-turn-helix domain-containing protein [Arthrobacter caoxuetaonis]